MKMKVVKKYGVEYSYDSNGNCVQEKYPSGEIKEMEYDDRNNMKLVKYPNGDVEKYEHDSNDNCTLIILSDGKTIEMKWNDDKKIIWMKSKYDVITEFNY